MNCFQSLDNNLKSIVKVVKKILGFLALIVSASAALSVVFIGSYQKSYCDYWNIDTQLINVSGNFSIHNILLIALGLALIFFSIGALINIPIVFKIKLKSIILTLFGWMFSSSLFYVGLRCVFSGVITSSMLLEIYREVLIQIGVIFSVLSFILVISLISIRSLINKFADWIISKVNTKFVLSNYSCLVVVGLIFILLLSMLGGQMGMFTAELKQDFYVYTETYSEVGDDGKTYNLDRVFVLVYSDGEKGIFESAVYEGQNSNQIYKYPKVRINTNEQVILSLEDLPLRRELFNRYVSSDLLEYQR